jgi:pimeloyl-ACP methyl ester carboxylesterase
LMLFPAMRFIGKCLGRPTPLNNQATLGLAIHDASNVTSALVETTNAHALIAGSAMSFHRALISGVGLLGARHMSETAALARSFKPNCLVLWGKQDRVFPADYAKNALAFFPHARLELLDACGHYPQWEQPQAFVKAVRSFLNEV